MISFNRILKDGQKVKKAWGMLENDKKTNVCRNADTMHCK